MTPPTKLKNPWWSRPFEFFVEMYGLPAYGETDVTGFVAITFTVLFGMMFGDVGQGIVLALFSTFMWKVKHNDLFHLMIPCGIFQYDLWPGLRFLPLAMRMPSTRSTMPLAWRASPFRSWIPSPAS